MMNFKKLRLGLVALVLGFGLVVTQSAFTAKSPVTFHLKAGMSISDVDQQSNYEAVSSPPQSCDTSEDNLPCLISYDTTEWSSLQDYLDSFSGPQRLQDITDAADVQRKN